MSKAQKILLIYYILQQFTKIWVIEVRFSLLASNKKKLKRTLVQNCFRLGSHKILFWPRPTRVTFSFKGFYGLLYKCYFFVEKLKKKTSTNLTTF